MITFYDIAAKEGISTVSPNPWKTRYVLNYKKLPYKTVALEYPDIEPQFKKLDIPPSAVKPHGLPLYTSPSIIDEPTKKSITDSYKIAEYLDEMYPETPRVTPKGAEALQAAFYDQFWQLMQPIFPVILPSVLNILNPVSAEYFDRTRTTWLGKPLKDMAKGEERIEMWKKAENLFDALNGWLSKGTGPFLWGHDYFRRFCCRFNTQGNQGLSG